MSAGIVQTQICFDSYKQEINDEWERYVAAGREGYKAAAKIGELLRLVKAKVGHGKFIAWIEENCDFDRYWAATLMRTSKVVHLVDVQSTAHLPPPPIEVVSMLDSFEQNVQKKIVAEWQEDGGDFKPIIKRHARMQKIEKRVANAEQFTEPFGELTKPVGIIVVDPPWRYDYSETTSREIENQYPTMTPEDLAALKGDIDSWSMDDCILYMWATSPKLVDAVVLMEAWGFTYKTCAIWDKKVDGMGYWFRQRHELLLVGVRGVFEPPADKDRVSSMIEAKRGKHSEKPTIVHELIEKWYPGVPKLEMFARNPRDGWFTWGNEV